MDEQTHWIDGSPIIDDDDRPELMEARARAAAGGPGFEPWAGQFTTGGRLRPGSTMVQHWYDLDAATAAALMVLGALAVPAAAVGYALARRFRVVRR